jgi:hypothetical protein
MNPKKILKTYVIILLAAAAVIELASPARLAAWNAAGGVPETEIEYSDMQVSKEGVTVKLANRSQTDVKVSLRVAFLDASGNEIGHSLFGLREIAAGSAAEVSRNYITGKWKECRDAPRAEWRKMTYEYLY